MYVKRTRSDRNRTDSKILELPTIRAYKVLSSSSELCTWTSIVSSMINDSLTMIFYDYRNCTVHSTILEYEKGDCRHTAGKLYV